MRRTTCPAPACLARHPLRQRSIWVSLLLVGAALWLVSPNAHAQWKWRDKNGQITASDLPPPRDVADKDILQKPEVAVRRPPPAAPAAPASGATAAQVAKAPLLDPELEKRKKATEAEQGAKAKAEEERVAATRRENCGRARSHLTTMESGQRVTRTNDKGEREFLDDNARATEVRRAREVIATDCR